MSEKFHYLGDLGALARIPENGILSQPIVNTGSMRVTLFGLAKGQEMTGHAASAEAIVHFLAGEIEITVDGIAHTACANSWLRMDPKLPHSLVAKTPASFCLIILR
ncbi:MAG: cupin domain-containing protein [Candidatus Hydrogenedentes bacterium]|nr:cupin domain-containing protein [Candidatus Hydrogenedentota bacterium]